MVRAGLFFEDNQEVTNNYSKVNIFYVAPKENIDGVGIFKDSKIGLIWQDDNESISIKKYWITQKNYDAKRYDDTSGDQQF